MPQTVFTREPLRKSRNKPKPNPEGTVTKPNQIFLTQPDLLRNLAIFYHDNVVCFQSIRSEDRGLDGSYSENQLSFFVSLPDKCRDSRRDK